MYLILEMCHNGEMSRYIKNRKKPFSEDEGETFFFSMNLSLYLHDDLFSKFLSSERTFIQFQIDSCFSLKTCEKW